VSVYFHDGRSNNEPAAVAYRDSIQITRGLLFGGEVASNGSVFLRTRYALSRLNLDTFYRYRPDFGDGQDKGAFASYDIWRGVTLGGGVRFSDATDDTSRWKLASLRAPIARGTIGLERTWHSSPTSESWTNAVSVQAPVGRIRLMHRYQWGDTSYAQRGLPLGFDRQQMQSAAAYSPARWLRLNYQVATQWLDDGRARLWDELHTQVQLTRHSRLQLFTAFPDPLDPERLRGRFTQDFGPHYTLVTEYGRLSAFQMARAFDGEKSRLLVMLRRNWNVPTPARGGHVNGRVVDQAGVPVQGAIVRLGQYRALTGEDGGYSFAKLPSGQFELKLDEERLPAHYANVDAPRTLNVNWRTRESLDLHVLPLNSIAGYVYWDRNRSGDIDLGEGIANAVVWLNGVATATDPAGMYAFYNQAPGPQTLRLDVDRLPNPYAPVSPVEVEVTLPAERSLNGINFSVRPRERPIIMQLGERWSQPR
jgi:hypothetical protein